MEELEQALEEYRTAFGESFPMFPFSGTEPAEIISIIQKCIAENKNPYEAGFLNPDTIY